MLPRARSVLAVFLLSSAAFGQVVKRPLGHQDFDAWRTISGQRLSPDGKFLAYGLFPEEGDGEVIVRDLITGKESRYPAGARPAPVPPSGAEEGPPPEPRTVNIVFSADSRTVVFSTFPTKAATDQARKQKKTGNQAPKDGMVIVDLATLHETRVERVQKFQLPEKASGVLAYLREAPESPPAAARPATPGGGDSDQQGGGRGARGGGAARGPRPEFGADLTLRKLADSTEQTFSDVVEFTLTDDGHNLVYAVSAHDASKNGVFLVPIGSSGSPAGLLTGKGKYLGLAWDDAQKQLAFLSDHDDASSKQPKWKLYRWERGAASAAELVSAETPGWRKEFVLSDKGAVTFSKDGTRAYFGCAPPAPINPPDDDSADDKAVVDLWSYKDDYIQPIQKVRAERERNRTYLGSYSIPDHKLVQLADPGLETATASENPQWVLGVDDRQYRRAFDYDEHYSDAWLIDGATGERRLIAKKKVGSTTWSPGGRYMLYFDGKDWITISVPDGKTTNLTAALPVKFWNEETDTPSLPNAYGNGGWTKDGRWLLLYDDYDIWRVAPDGSSATNLTAGYGRKHDLRVRYVRVDTDPRDVWIDPAQPVLLSAENQKTRESGFFRGSFEGGEPKQLIMAAKSFTSPVKAKNADVYLLAEQSFTEFPDLVTTNASFRELRKVTHANPQQAEFLWGTAELISYRNADGVPLRAALYKPENFDPKKKYPMMVYLYEKLTQNVNHFVNPAPSHNINFSFYVSRGYLVLTPDIVYTVGYPGQSALKCVLPAVQAVVDRGFVDEKAIGIQGHSWGGYQIAYMVTQTNRFRAVAAGAPVADMISAYDGIRWGTGIPRQFQYERTQSRIGGSIWQYPTRYIENSPIFWADRVQTPVMILQNDGDDAVPWYQGIEFFLALRRLGKEVYFFDYNGQPHGLRNRADQKDYTMRLQQYFDHYLKGAPAPEWMEKGVSYLDRDKTELSARGSHQ